MPCGLEPVDRPFLRRGDVQAVEEPLLIFTRSPVYAPPAKSLRGLDGPDDRQVVQLGEREVPVVLGGHGHDRAGAVPAST
jgi:hypothetical protein